MNDCVMEFPERICGPISARFGLTAVVAGMIFWSGATKAADASTAFTGEKTAWHGFDRSERQSAGWILSRAPTQRCP